MAGYNLQPGECFVHKQDRALHNGAYLNELILTSQSLVLVKTIKKGLFGSEQVTQVLPLNQIKIFQGHAQAIPGKHQGSWHTLDVYFQNGSEQFSFQSKKEATFWSQKIDQVITGTPAKMTTANPSGAEQVTEVIKDTVGALRDAWASRSKSEIAAAAAAVAVAGDCVSCGAPVSGVRGQAIICSYCDTANQL